MSPKYNDKYDKYDPDGYLFDKDKFLDQSKIGNGRNIKRRGANDYYDKYRDRWISMASNSVIYIAKGKKQFLNIGNF